MGVTLALKEGFLAHVTVAASQDDLVEFGFLDEQVAMARL